MIMELIQAQKIINRYSRLLANVNEKQLFMSRTELPCSDAMIKYAFYTYVDELVRMHKMNFATAESLIVAYAHLSFFVDGKQVETLNRIANREFNTRRDEETLALLENNRNTLKLLSDKKEQMIQELSEYISDCIRVAQN